MEKEQLLKQKKILEAQANDLKAQKAELGQVMDDDIDARISVSNWFEEALFLTKDMPEDNKELMRLEEEWEAKQTENSRLLEDAEEDLRIQQQKVEKQIEQLNQEFKNQEKGAQ